MSWAPFYAFYFQLQIAFFLSSLACNNNFSSSFLFFQIVVCKLQLQISKIIVARESGKFMQHRLRIWLLESLTKILVPSWKKGLFIFHFISTLEDFVFWLLLNLMWQICCTQKLDLQTWIGGIPCTSMWWIFHIHVADLIYSKLHMIWFTQNFT